MAFGLPLSPQAYPVATTPRRSGLIIWKSPKPAVPLPPYYYHLTLYRYGNNKKEKNPRRGDTKVPDPIVSQSLDLKQVVNTNKCLVHIDAFDNKLLVTSCIDNLLKGAVGQAVQNMNLMFGIDETAGLRLKASVF